MHYNTKAKIAKRIALAKEVLSQFDLGKIQATKQVYCILSTNGYSCDVCADGALAVACCGVEKMQEANANMVVECLRPYFSLTQLALIEAAFEQTDIRYATVDYNVPIKEKLKVAAKKYKPVWRSYTGNGKYEAKWVAAREERLQKIMRNIIRNKGTFVV